MGPYESEAFARKSLDEFKERWLLIGNDADRASDSHGGFELVQDGTGLTVRKVNPLKSA